MRKLLLFTLLFSFSGYTKEGEITKELKIQLSENVYLVPEIKLDLNRLNLSDVNLEDTQAFVISLRIDF